MQVGIIIRIMIMMIIMVMIKMIIMTMTMNMIMTSMCLCVQQASYQNKIGWPILALEITGILRNFFLSTTTTTPQFHKSKIKF